MFPREPNGLEHIVLLGRLLHIHGLEVVLRHDLHLTSVCNADLENTMTHTLEAFAELRFEDADVLLEEPQDN